MSNTAQKQEQGHTAGPWEVAEVKDDFSDHSIIARMAGKTYSFVVATAHKDRGNAIPLAEIEANARLIAAAPETARERDAWRKRAEDEHAKALENHSQTIKAEAQRDELLKITCSMRLSIAEEPYGATEEVVAWIKIVDAALARLGIDGSDVSELKAAIAGATS